MEKSLVLAQSNVITQGRYDFSVVEKRAVYFIIQEVRKQFVESPDGQKDLFDNLVVKINSEAIKKSDSRLEDIYEALRKLRKKEIFINNETEAFSVGYINYFHHKKKDSFIEVEVSKVILPYLVALAKEFTVFYLTVAISLKNKYSQRFYEYCSQWKKTGFFTFSPLELREKLMLETKYNRYALIKARVIEPAQKELKTLYDSNQSDLYFTYTEEKNGRTVERLKFTVYWSEAEKEAMEGLKLEDFVYYIRTWLSEWLKTSERPKNKTWVEQVIKSLQINPDNLPPCYKKLVWIQKHKPREDWAPYARYVIDEEFLIEEKTTEGKK